MITGLGMNNRVLALNVKEAPMYKQQIDFNQVFNTLLQNNDSQKNLNPFTGVRVKINELINLQSFLKLNDVRQLNGGEELQKQLLSIPKPDLLQMVQNYFGISDQKWSEIINELKMNSNKQEENDEEVITAIMSGFSDLQPNQLLMGMNENSILLLKAAKLYDLLLVHQGGGLDQQPVSGLLDDVKKKFSSFMQSSENDKNFRFPENVIPIERGNVIRKIVEQSGTDDRKVEPKQINVEAPVAIQDTQKLNEVLALLSNDHLFQVENGIELRNLQLSNPESDALQIVKNYLEINDEKWSEMVDGLQNYFISNDEKWSEMVEELQNNFIPRIETNQNAITSILSRLSRLNSNQLQSGINEQTLLFLKAAKLYDLLLDNPNGGVEKQNVTGPLDAVKEKLSVLAQGNEMNQRFDFQKNTIPRESEYENQRIVEQSGIDDIKVEPKQMNVQTPMVIQDTQKLNEMLTLLNIENLSQVENGLELQNQLLSMPKTDPLQIVKKYLEISDEKWSEMVDGSKTNFIPKIETNQNVITAILNRLSQLNSNQLQSEINEQTLTFLKAAKLYDLLLVNQVGGIETQNVTGPLDAVKGKLLVIKQENQSNPTLQFRPILPGIPIVKNKRLLEINNTNGKTHDWSGNHFVLQGFSKPELSNMLKGSQNLSSANEIIQQFEAILSKSHFSRAEGVQKLLIKLNPDHLGSIRIELIQKDQTIVAKILTSTQIAKEALESHLHSLKQAFSAQNIQVDRVEIGQQFSPFQSERFLNRDSQNHQNQHEQGHRQKEERDEETNNGFTNSLEEALLNKEA